MVRIWGFPVVGSARADASQAKDVHPLHLATPDPVPPFPTPTIISLSVYGSSAPLLPSSRPPSWLQRNTSPPTLLSNAPSTQFAQPPGSFSRPSSDVRALRRCCHPQEQPQTGAVLVEISYLPANKPTVSINHGSSSHGTGSFLSPLFLGADPSVVSDVIGGARDAHAHTATNLSNVSSQVPALGTVKHERSLASRAPNPSIVPGEVRSNCSLQRLTFSSSRRDAFSL